MLFVDTRVDNIGCDVLPTGIAAVCVGVVAVLSELSIVADAGEAPRGVFLLLQVECLESLVLLNFVDLKTGYLVTKLQVAQCGVPHAFGLWVSYTGKSLKLGLGGLVKSGDVTAHLRQRELGSNLHVKMSALISC